RSDDLAVHEREKRLPGRAFDRRTQQDPAVRGEAIVRAWFEQERFAGENHQRLVEARAVTERQIVAVVTTDTVNACDIAHQLPYGDRPWLLRIRGNVRLDRRVEVEPRTIVKQGEGRCGDRF